MYSCIALYQRDGNRLDTNTIYTIYSANSVRHLHHLRLLRIPFRFRHYIFGASLISYIRILQNIALQSI